MSDNIFDPDDHLVEDGVDAAKLLGLGALEVTDIFGNDGPLESGLSLDAHAWEIAPNGDAEPAQHGHSALVDSSRPASLDVSEVEAARSPIEPAEAATSTPPVATPKADDDTPYRHNGTSTSHTYSEPAEEHRIPYSMGQEELERLRLVLLKALGSVRGSVAQELNERGMDLSGNVKEILIKRAQIVLYYMRVHEVSVDLLKDLHLVELVHMLQREPGLESLTPSCAQLLRHGNWGRRAAVVGMHPDTPANGGRLGPSPLQHATGIKSSMGCEKALY